MGLYLYCLRDGTNFNLIGRSNGVVVKTACSILLSANIQLASEVNTRNLLEDMTSYG